MVRHARVALSYLGLNGEVEGNVLKGVAVDSVEAFVWGTAVVASEDHELAVMYD